jgi:hypothetical protein
MSHPFVYAPESIYDAKALIKAGKKLIKKPERGDLVCGFSFFDSKISTLFVVRSEDSKDYSLVNEWFNRQKIEWKEDFFVWEEFY